MKPLAPLSGAYGGAPKLPIAPLPSYGKQSYGPPQGYKAPIQSYGPPKNLSSPPSYGPPNAYSSAPSYGPPKGISSPPTYGPPAKGYGGIPAGFGPAKGIGSYGPPKINGISQAYGGPPKSLGGIPAGFGPSSVSNPWATGAKNPLSAPKLPATPSYDEPWKNNALADPWGAGAFSNPKQVNQPYAPKVK